MITFNIHVDEATATRLPRLRKALRSRRGIIALATVLSIVPVVAIASPVDIPNTFSAGDVISSSEMNDNFAAVEAAIDDNDSRIGDLAAATLGGCTWASTTDTNVTHVDVVCPTDTHPISAGCANSNTGFPLRTSRPLIAGGGAVSDGDSISAVTGWRCIWEGAATESNATALCCAL